MNRGRRTGRRFSRAVQTRADQLIGAGLSAREVHEVLAKEFATDEIPAPRTVQGWVANYADPRPAEWWTVRDATSPAEAAPILEVLGYLIRTSGYRAAGITRAEARYVAIVRAAAPKMHPLLAHRLAQLYARREASGLSTADLDAVLALRPWSGDRAYREYKELYDRRVATGRTVEPTEAETVADPGVPVTAESWGAIEAEAQLSVDWDQTVPDWPGHQPEA